MFRFTRNLDGVVPQRMGNDFEAFDKPYLRYDWKRAGYVGTAEFMRATVRCGFPLTRAQVSVAFTPGTPRCWGKWSMPPVATFDIERMVPLPELLQLSCT